MLRSLPARVRATAAAVRPRLDPRAADPLRLAVTAGVLALSAFCLLWRLGGADWRIDEQLDGTAAWRAVGGDWAVEIGHPVFVRWFLGAGQVLFGTTRLGVRIGPALASLALVALLLAYGRRVAGFWPGAVAAGVWGLTPRPVVVAGEELFAVRPDRYAYLEPWSSLFLVAATWAGWAWVRRGGWRLAVGTGALVGLGAAFKPTVGLVVPAIGIAALVARRDVRRVVAEGAALAGAAVAVLLASYAPLGTGGPGALWRLVRFQGEHVDQGHAVVVGDTRTIEQAWWTNLWDQWHGSGAALTVVLVGGALAALTGRHRAVAAYLWLVLVVVVGAHLASPVALPHYHALWLPLLALLAGIGLTDLLADGARVARAAAALALAVLVVAGAVGVGRVATLPEGDLDRVARRVEAAGVEPRRIVYAGEPVAPVFPDGQARFFGYGGPVVVPPDLMLLDLDYARLLPAAQVGRFRATALAAGLTPHRVGDWEAWW